MWFIFHQFTFVFFSKLYHGILWVLVTTTECWDTARMGDLSVGSVVDLCISQWMISERFLSECSTESEFGHVWLNWTAYWHAYSLQSWIYLGFTHIISAWIYLALDVSCDYESGWCYYGLTGIMFTLGGFVVDFTIRTPYGSSARWCVENWPLVSHMWPLVSQLWSLDSFWC